MNKVMIIRTFFREIIIGIFQRYFASQVDTRIKIHLLEKPVIFGDPHRVEIDPSASIMNALFNTSSGNINIGKDVTFGHNVCLITGSHDYTKKGVDRQQTWVTTGNDIVVEEGAWIGSNVTVIGPCRIKENSVVAAGSVVIRDVETGTIVGGVPAKFIKQIEFQTDCS